MRSLVAFSVAALFAAPAAALAQAYPERPIRVIVPYAPGGGTDITTRTVAVRLAESLKSPVVVDNRPGAAGNIGKETAARATPDGYTLLTAGLSFAVNPSLFSKLGYHPVKDFEPISLIATAPLIVVVHPSVPATSIKELVALARAKPGSLNYASGGIGTGNHVAGELFKYMTKVDIVHVPYKGGGPALADVVAGHVQILFNTTTSTVPFTKSGKLRALAITGAQRSPGMRDLPTVAESGVPGFDVAVWFGLVAPARTPRAVIDTLNVAIVRITRMPEAREQFAAQGADPVGSTPAQFAQHIRTEVEKWAKVAKAAGLKAD